MEFAKAQLSKYGWQEGKGLGKNESGITEAIKPKLKFNNSGIGYDGAENFTYFWWQHAFNGASKNIDICKKEDDVSLKASQDFNISTKKFSSKKRKNLVFNNFLKSATTLTNKGLVTTVTEDNETTEPSENDVNAKEFNLTDEELFEACGGRTAHKGARHGLKLSGKLARVEEQERKLLLMLSTNPKVGTALSQECKKKNLHDESMEDPPHIEARDRDVPNKHKKKKSTAVVENSEDDTPIEKVKKCNKNKNVELPVLEASLDFEILESNEACKSRNSIDKRKKKRLEKDDVWNDNTISDNTTKKQKKSKRKDKTPSADIEAEQRITVPVYENSTKTRKKKRRKIPDSEEMQSDGVMLANSQCGKSSVTDADIIVKKAKKSKRK